jgi:sugar lactone lactonase YvrE
MKIPRSLVPVSLLLAALAVAGPAPAAAPGVTVVMSGLDNPRGLAMDKDGTLYVAEAGKGGAGRCAPGPEGGLVCEGQTGAISRLRHGVQRRIVTRLPSHAVQDPPAAAGAGAIGPHDLSLHGGALYATIGLGGGPAHRAALGEDFGWLIRVNEERGTWRKVADIASYEFANNPDRGVPDSNPYGLLARPGRRVLTDAGGNSLLRVADDGDISTLATFPSRAQGRKTDAVPTCVAVGPDGAYYVGELSGVPFATGAARVYRVVPGHAPTVYLDGFTTIIDLAFGPDGSLYVLQHSSAGPFFAVPGSLVRVAPDGTRTTILTGLTRPTSVLLATKGTHDEEEDGEHAGDDDGHDDDHGQGRARSLVFYISNRGTSPAVGEVIRFEP